MALQAENVRRVSRRGFGEPCQAELLPRRMYLTGTRWMPQGGSRNEENESDHSEILAAGPEAPSGESPLPGRDAGGFLHYRGPRHPPHPRPPPFLPAKIKLPILWSRLDLMVRSRDEILAALRPRHRDAIRPEALLV
jgi:hypothetical protein